MNLEILFKYSAEPSLFENGTSIMWTDPYISKQLLECHINPNNDMASRSNTKIELLVNWILSIAHKEQMDVLDLG